MDKKRLIWALLSVLIAVLSVWAVISQNKQFSFLLFVDFISQSDKLFLLGAVLCMFGFVWFGGISIHRMVLRLGYSSTLPASMVYGATDVYFSAITPSASGGQPACAYYMMKKKIPGSVTTVVLITNLMMYTLVLFLLGSLCLFLRIDLFISFSVLSKILIISGIIILAGLTFVFYLLLCKDEILYRICDWGLRFFAHLRLLRNLESKREKLQKVMEEYRLCANTIREQQGMLLETFFWNIIQRISQLGVVSLAFLATGQSIKKAIDVWFVQCFVALGSNCIPVPGAMGVADYLMLDGYHMIVGKDLATHMELLCRTLSFYGCVGVSGVIVLVAILMRKVKDRKC